ncbi:hypothetical protein KUCAC02_027326 [Chaenocephalus aceratus]|uniref:Uncharacterized protein n=1 Tax=Chaenocephalus aceratus TaxID=36190 RepID=A0ACB9W4U2_CHAAC|nr:hypothetical protein KUCAC02_027326 [Chaenocephalus aceratus]
MTEKSLEKITSFSWDRDSEDMEEDSATMFDVFNSHLREEEPANLNQNCLFYCVLCPVHILLLLAVIT